VTKEQEATLETIFRVVFDLPDDRDLSSVRRITERKWDSLGHVSMVSALESEFDITIGAADSDSLQSFDSVRLFLSGKLG
jgi:acyl carrier protein